MRFILHGRQFIHDARGGMIEWIKQKNGGWQFDYKIFDEYVQLAMECGINARLLRCIQLFRGVTVSVTWTKPRGIMYTNHGNPEQKIFKKHWHIFLTDLKNILSKRMVRHYLYRNKRKSNAANAGGHQKRLKTILKHGKSLMQVTSTKSLTLSSMITAICIRMNRLQQN